MGISLEVEFFAVFFFFCSFFFFLHFFALHSLRVKSPPLYLFFVKFPPPLCPQNAIGTLDLSVGCEVNFGLWPGPSAPGVGEI